MLLSMTGHGRASVEGNGTVVSFEIRSVNGRHLKIALRSGDSLLELSAKVEAEIRSAVRRGTLQAQLLIEREAREEDYRLQRAALRSYYRQVAEEAEQLGAAQPRLEGMLALPGVVIETSRERGIGETEWPLVQQAVREALEQLNRMRQAEGAAMKVDLERNLEIIAGQLQRIRGWAPEVVERYRERLEQRIASLLGRESVEGAEAEIAREVALFADRCDISEETVRLTSHLEQFRGLLEAETSEGRKLEFLLQEMNREANTMAAKANDSRISQAAVEIKAALERMREMVQNIE